MEQIANITLSHLSNVQVLSQNVTEKCQNNEDYKVQKNLLILQNETENSSSLNKYEQIISDMPKMDNSSETGHNDVPNSEYEIKLTKKYLEMWKNVVNSRKDEKEIITIQSQEDKLDSLIETLKKMKRDEDLKKSEKYELNSEKSRSSYKNRFLVQKNIINLQKTRLEEQNKIIEELKLGIIREDILKSIENTKINIKEIFAGCSEKNKCRIPAVFVEENKFNVNIQKAPKIIQQMEERALQRERKREIILERKKIIENMRQKLLEEAIEKKRVLEEEDRKRNLEIMKEKRKKELELERIRHEKRKQFEEKMNIAVEFHTKLLKQQCIRKLYNNLMLSREKKVVAIVHFKNKVLRECLNLWMDFVDSLYIVKYEIADAHFSYKMLKKCLDTWKEVIITNRY